MIIVFLMRTVKFFLSLVMIGIGVFMFYYDDKVTKEDYRERLFSQEYFGKVEKIFLNPKITYAALCSSRRCRGFCIFTK